MLCQSRGKTKITLFWAGAEAVLSTPRTQLPALIALQAEITISGRKGDRTIPVEDLFQLPREDSRQLTVLEPGEIITGIHIPGPPGESMGIYLKAMERRVWSFAKASIAVQMNFTGAEIKNARVVLGGVAPIPWRLPQLEGDFPGERIMRL